MRASAWGGHTEVVKLLLEAGAAVDSADSDQRTALRAAAWGGHEGIVEALLRAGADVNRTDDEGRTALIAAAYMGHAGIVEHLLNYGAHINHEDADGRTALSVAALCVPANEGYVKVRVQGTQESVRQDNCSTVSGVVRLGFVGKFLVGQLPAFRVQNIETFRSTNFVVVSQIRL